jgi:hypothetical protein
MSATHQNAVRCRALTKDGQPCTAFVVRDGLCIGHQPDAARAQRKGGAATSNAERAAKALPKTLRWVSTTLTDALKKVARGELTPAQGSAMASIANALVHVYQVDEIDRHLRLIEKQASDEGRFKDHKGRENGPIQWPTYMDD